MARFVQACRELGCAGLIRQKRNRTLYRPAPPRTGKRGAPRKHGPLFHGTRPETHGPADGQWEGVDEQRFLKQDWLWTQVHLHTPDQVERWSWLVACACHQLLLCQYSDLAVLRPWESRNRRKMNLSRFQTVLWSVLILSAFLAAALTNLPLVSNPTDALSISIPRWFDMFKGDDIAYDGIWLSLVTSRIWSKGGQPS